MTADVKEMEIQDYNILQNVVAAFYRLWKMKIIVVLVTVIGILASLIYTTSLGNAASYYATATIYSAVYGSYQETVSGITIMNTYSSVLGTSRVCNRAAALVDDSTVTAQYLKSLVSAGNIYLSGASTESKSYGYRLTMVVNLDDATKVEKIANAMASAFASEINELLGADIIQVFDEANGYSIIYQFSRKKTMLIFAAAAFVLSCAVIFIKEFFSARVYIVAQCEKDKDMILGIVPYNKRG